MKNIITTLLIIISLITFLISCKGEQVPSHSIDDKTLRLNDRTNYYSIAIPHDYNENIAYPVFFALHWGGDSNFNSGSNFLSTFASEGLEKFKGFIIAPSCPAAAGWIHEDSELLIFSILEKIKNSYNIDSTKIVIGGYSMGGVGTWYYATTFPEIFKVAVPISSSPPNYMLPINDIIPTYAIHGTHDEVFPLQTVRTVVHDIKIHSNVIRLTEINGASHFETDKFIKPLAESLEWIESYWD